MQSGELGKKLGAIEGVEGRETVAVDGVDTCWRGSNVGEE